MTDPAALEAKFMMIDRQIFVLNGTVFTQRRKSNASVMMIMVVIIDVGSAVSGVKRLIRGEIASAWQVEGCIRMKRQHIAIAKVGVII
jgi:hypothetical protein